MNKIMNKSNNLTSGLIKLISSLKNKKKREKISLFLVEGNKLCTELYKSTYKTKFIILKKEHCI